MGVIVYISPVIGAGTVLATMVGATVINNDLTTLATNLSTLDTTCYSVNSAVDWEVLVADTGGTTEYRFTNTVRNTSFQSWHTYWMQLGFFTGASFALSGTTDQLDFDTSGILGAENFQPPPTHTFPPETGTPVATTYSANDMIYGTGVLGTIYGTPTTGVNTVAFSLDVPDFHGDMPALASFTGGYRFTLRQFGLATALVTPAMGTSAYAWIR